MILPEPTYTCEEFHRAHTDLPDFTYRRHELNATLLTTFNENPDVFEDFCRLERPQPVKVEVDYHWAILDLPGYCEVSVRMTENTCIVRVQERDGDLIQEIVVERTPEEAE